MSPRWAADRLNSWHTRLHKSYESFRLAGKFVAWVFCLFIFSLPTEEKLRLKTEKCLSWFVVPSNGFQLLPRWVSHWGVFNVNWLLYSTGHWASPCWHLHILPPINVSSYIYIYKYVKHAIIIVIPPTALESDKCIMVIWMTRGV